MISYYIISYHIISYHIISYHIISYHIISYHIILYQSYHIILVVKDHEARDAEATALREGKKNTMYLNSVFGAPCKAPNILVGRYIELLIRRYIELSMIRLHKCLLSFRTEGYCATGVCEHIDNL